MRKGKSHRTVRTPNQQFGSTDELMMVTIINLLAGSTKKIGQHYPHFLRKGLRKITRRTTEARGNKFELFQRIVFNFIK